MKLETKHAEIHGKMKMLEEECIFELCRMAEELCEDRFVNGFDDGRRNTRKAEENARKGKGKEIELAQIKDSETRFDEHPDDYKPGDGHEPMELPMGTCRMLKSLERSRDNWKVYMAHVGANEHVLKVSSYFYILRCPDCGYQVSGEPPCRMFVKHQKSQHELLEARESKNVVDVLLRWGRWISNSGKDRAWIKPRLGSNERVEKGAAHVENRGSHMGRESQQNENSETENRGKDMQGNEVQRKESWGEEEQERGKQPDTNTSDNGQIASPVGLGNEFPDGSVLTPTVKTMQYQNPGRYSQECDLWNAHS